MLDLSYHIIYTTLRLLQLLLSEVKTILITPHVN